MDDKDKKIQEMRRELHDCRNELCLKCGKYENKHLGACEGCRWDDNKKWEKL